MSAGVTTLRTLMGDELDRRLNERREFLPRDRGVPVDFVDRHRDVFRDRALIDIHAHLLDRATSIRQYRHWVEEESAAGSPAEMVRGVARRAAEPWAEIVPHLDFCPRVSEDPGGAFRPAAEGDHLVEMFGAEIIEQRGNRVRCRWREIRQPFRTEVQRALECAAISGDATLAAKLARAYPLPPPQRLTTKYAVREALLRHAMADDDDAKAATPQLLERLEPGYAADFPSDLIEFPQGVLLGDPGKLTRAMKTTTTRFKNRWNPKKWLKKHAEGATTRSWSSEPQTIEQFLVGVAGQLLSLNWGASTWALAWLNIAHWRGMKQPFDQPTLFSEWIRLDLCVS